MEHTISKVIGSSKTVIKSSPTNATVIASIFQKQEPLSPDELYSSVADFPEDTDYTTLIPLSAFGYKKSGEVIIQSNVKKTSKSPTVIKKSKSKAPAVVKHKVKSKSAAKINEKKNSDIATNDKNNRSELSIKKNI